MPSNRRCGNAACQYSAAPRVISSTLAVSEPQESTLRARDARFVAGPAPALIDMLREEERAGDARYDMSPTAAAGETMAPPTSLSSNASILLDRDSNSTVI